MMKRLSLELGGKNPALVFEDANMEQAVATLIRAAFLNQAKSISFYAPELKLFCICTVVATSVLCSK